MGNRLSRRKSKSQIDRDLEAQKNNGYSADFKQSITSLSFDADKDPFYENGDCSKDAHIISVHQCGPFRRIKQRLQIYKSWIVNQTTETVINDRGIYEEINCDISDLLDDYHHIVKCHNLSDLYDNLDSKCDQNVIECISLKRNYRNKLSNQNENIHSELYFVNQTDYVNIACQQILDQIHSYLLHSYHCGYSLKQSDISCIMNIHNTESDFLSGQSPEIKAVQVTLKRYKEESECDKLLDALKQSDKKQMRYNEYPVHDFGTRFSYYGKCDGVSRPKYKNIQQELLQCDSFNFNLNEWNIINIKAKYHLNKSMYKITCRLDTSSHCNIYEEGALITIEHLICLLIYTNYYEIKYYFCNTFKKLYLSEPDKKRLKRHSIFSNMGRLLQEAVNLFGFSNMKENTNWGVPKLKYIYYGLNEIKSFYFMLGAFKRHGPMSTHRNLIPALSSYKGIILKTEYIASGRHFWSEYLSDFTGQQEILLMGRYRNSFNFRTVINICNGIDYYPYIAALNVIESFTRNSWGVLIEDTNNLNPKIHSIVVQLFNYAINGCKDDDDKYLNKCPKYIKALWRLHLTRSIIIIPVNYILTKLWFVEKLIYDKRVAMIKLNVLLTMFRNTKRLQFKGCSPNDSKMQYVYNFLSQSSLKEKQRMRNDDKFNCINYFCRKYEITLEKNIIDLLYRYFGNGKLEMIKFDKFCHHDKKYKERFIAKWNKKFNNINFEVTGSDDVTIKYKYNMNTCCNYNCIDFLNNMCL